MNEKKLEKMRYFEKQVRKIGPKLGSLSGYFVSNKKENNNLIQFESALERDFIYLLEFDKSVVCYLEQPLTINYLDFKQKKRRYTPDFFVRYRDENRKDEIVEIKYHKYLSENYFLLKPKFDATIQYCKDNSLTFRVLTEKEIRIGQEDYLFNINFLLAYRNIFRNRRTESESENDFATCTLIIEKLQLMTCASINILIDSIENSKIEKGSILYYIWFLLANNYINCDLQKRITSNTVIWVT